MEVAGCGGRVSGRGCGCGLEPGGGCSAIGALDSIGSPVGAGLTCCPRLVVNFGIALVGFAFKGGAEMAPPIVGVAFCCCCCGMTACAGSIGVGVTEILCSVGMVGGGALPPPCTTDVELEREGGGGMVGTGLLRAG